VTTAVDNLTISLASCEKRNETTMENYEKIKALGQGTWGVVHMAKQKTTGRFVAIKKIKSERPEEGWVCSEFVISSSPKQTHTAAFFVV